MKNAVICLGAGYNQIQYLKEIHKNKKNKIICVDKNPKSKGFRYAKEKIICSTHDHYKILKILEKKFKKTNIINVIAPSTGNPYKTAQFLKKKYNLKYVEKKKVEILLDKTKLRRVLNNLKCSNIPLIKNIQVPKKNFTPIVKKPRFNGMGGKGVKIVKNFNNLKKEKNLSNKTFTFERYIQGKELAVDFIWDKNKIKFLNAGWHIYNKKNQKIVGATSQKIDTNIMNKLKNHLRKICKYFKFFREVINLDLIVDKQNNLHVIELEFAPHEGLYLSRECFNYNLIKNFVNCYMNRKIDNQRKRIKEAFVTILNKKKTKTRELKKLNFFLFDKNIKKSSSLKSKLYFTGVSIKKDHAIEKIIKNHFEEISTIRT